MAITVKTKLGNAVNHAGRQNVAESTLIYDFWAPIAIDGETYRRAITALKNRDSDAKLTAESIRAELQRIALAGFRAEIKRHRPDNAADVTGFAPPKPPKRAKRTRKPAKSVTATVVNETAAPPVIAASDVGTLADVATGGDS